MCISSLKIARAICSLTLRPPLFLLGIGEAAGVVGVGSRIAPGGLPARFIVSMPRATVSTLTRVDSPWSSVTYTCPHGLVVAEGHERPHGTPVAHPWQHDLSSSGPARDDSQERGVPCLSKGLSHDSLSVVVRVLTSKLVP